MELVVLSGQKKVSKNNIGSFFVVDSLINSGDSSNINIANAINNAIATTNDVDVTQKQFNAQYIAYLKNQRKANVAAILDFETLAQLCPNAYGYAVYQARTVLFNITHKQYANACEKVDLDDDSRHRMAKTPLESPAEATLIKLYPNPSNGNLMFETNDDLSYQLTVYNIMGEKVFESIVTNKQALNLNNLPSATYIVLIHYNNNLVKTERISIIH